MRQALVVVACSGLALSAQAQDAGGPGGERIGAASATKIVALRVDGTLVLGETISLNGTAANRGGCDLPAFDQLSAVTECGFGDLYPQSGVIQSAVEDVVPASGSEGALIGEFSLAGARPLCDGGTGTTSEVFQLVVLSWEVMDNIADLDGTDGFAAPPMGLVTPMELLDTDGDTFIDGFNGGAILTYADTDTDGDTLNDELLSSGASGFSVYFASGLETLGIPMPSGVDANSDGRPDGGVQVIMSRGFNDDGQGPLFAGLYPATNSRMLFGSTAEDDDTLCLLKTGFGQGSSNGTLWAEGMSECGGGAGWSDGSLSPAADELYDPLVDIRDLDGVLMPPDPSSIGIAMKIDTIHCIGDPECCDANGDGACTAADFTAWINQFNINGPRCDVNQDGMCTPSDFTAWISAYNASQAGNPMLCVF